MTRLDNIARSQLAIDTEFLNSKCTDVTDARSLGRSHAAQSLSSEPPPLAAKGDGPRVVATEIAAGRDLGAGEPTS
jgi:hypothetical protein